MGSVKMFLKIFGLITLFGLAVAAPGSRIVNGTDANIEDYPFIVSLRSYNSHSCGASILSPDWILTAAHCVSSSVSGVSIQYGTSFISSVGNVIDAERTIRHEKYSPANSYINDIALIKLKSSIPLGPNAQPTKLPPQFFEVPEDNNGCTLIGWGLEKSGGSVQKRLQEVDYFIVSNPECNKIHSSTIHPTHICASWPNGGKGQCSGDSGGPLLSNGFQVGLVSWSVKPCAVAPYPGVFTKTSHYVDWIKEKTGLAL